MSPRRGRRSRSHRDARPATPRTRRLKLAPGQFIRNQPGAGRTATLTLVKPDGSIPLTASAAAILTLCDGTRTLHEIVEGATQGSVSALHLQEVRAFLRIACELGWVLEC